MYGTIQNNTMISPAKLVKKADSVQSRRGRFDAKYIKFETGAIWWAQAIKLVLGLIPMLLIKSLLKAPLTSLIGVSYIADGVRYLILVLFAGCVWPLTFKFFSKLGTKK